MLLHRKQTFFGLKLKRPPTEAGPCQKSPMLNKFSKVLAYPDHKLPAGITRSLAMPKTPAVGTVSSARPINESVPREKMQSLETTESAFHTALCCYPRYFLRWKDPLKYTGVHSYYRRRSASPSNYDQFIDRTCDQSNEFAIPTNKADIVAAGT